ncbi:unnamed protein product, partial [Ixodes persulcatus]
FSCRVPGPSRTVRQNPGPVPIRRPVLRRADGAGTRDGPAAATLPRDVVRGDRGRRLRPGHAAGTQDRRLHGQRRIRDIRGLQRGHKQERRLRRGRLPQGYVLQPRLLLPRFQRSELHCGHGQFVDHDGAEPGHAGAALGTVRGG